MEYMDLSTEEVLKLLTFSYNEAARAHFIGPKIDLILQNQERMLTIMSADQDHINALANQLDKATAEIKAEIDSLKSQPAAESLDFSALDGKVQALDDLHADSPAPEQPANPAPVDPILPVEPEAPQEPTFPTDGTEVPTVPVDPATGLPTEVNPASENGELPSL